MMKRIFVLIVSIILVNCSITGTALRNATQNEINSASYEPIADNYKDQIMHFMMQELSNPETAQYTYHPPVLSFHKRYHDFALAVPVDVYNKNFDGKYVEYGRYYFAQKEGTLRAYTNSFIWSHQVIEHKPLITKDVDIETTN